MKLALREDMSRGGTLAEQLAWLDGLGFEGIELLRTSPVAEHCRTPTPPHF